MLCRASGDQLTLMLTGPKYLISPLDGNCIHVDVAKQQEIKNLYGVTTESEALGQPTEFLLHFFFKTWL